MYVETLMTDSDGPDANTSAPNLGFARSWEESLEQRSTKERVYEVATTLTEPTRVAAVAELAECSKGGARTTLEWLTELGVVEKVADDPAMYQRNEIYFDFRRVYRLTQEHSTGELEQLIGEYERHEQDLADQFDVESPSVVDELTTVDFDELDTAYDRLSEWQTVRRRLRELQRARLMQQHDYASEETSVA